VAELVFDMQSMPGALGLGAMGHVPMAPEGVMTALQGAKDEKKEVLLQAMVRLAAFLKELETQAHLIHLNYEGSNFLSIHGFLKDQYELHLQQFDRVAELVRTMDMYMPMCACGLKDAVSCFENVKSYAGMQQLSAYLNNLEQMGQMAKEAEPMAQCIGAIDVANYMAELVGSAFQGAWFIKASLRA
jgi:DNA-binding ferritin-like protein